MLYSGIQESCGIDFLKKEIPNPRGILDVGSYDGGDAQLLRATYPDSEIHSVEASPLLFANINKTHNIRWHNVALGKDEKQITLNQSWLSDNSLHCATKYLGKAHRYAEFTVNQTTVKNLWIKHATQPLDLLWIDVDGMDYDVIMGMEDSRPKIVSFECNGSEWWSDAPSQSELYYLIGEVCGYTRIWENHHTCVWRKND